MSHVDWWSISLITAAAVGCAGKIDNSALFTSEPRGAAPLMATEDRAGTTAQPPTAPTATQNAGPARVAAGSGMDASVAARADSGQAVGTRSASGSGGSAKPDARTTCDFRGLMQAKCGTANCHGAPATGTGLDLTSAALAMRVSGRKAAGACGDELLIDQAAPDRSVLYLKVAGDSCGLTMPPGGSLTPPEQDCVLSWIEGLPPPAAQDAGAPRLGADSARDASTPTALDSGSVNDSQSDQTDPSPTAPNPQPACDFRGLMQAKCAGASCHGGPSNSTGLDLTSASLATRVEGQSGGGACSSELLIDKNNPSQSVLYLKVAGTECGTRMPVGGTLTADDQDCVLSWIEGL